MIGRSIVAGVVVGITLLSASAGHAQVVSEVSGQVSILFGNNRPVRDVGRAVIWLEAGQATEVSPDTVQIVMTGKAFRPSVVVVPAGSTVIFPNLDPFDHNVFSLAGDARFDLGFYGRGVARSTTFPNAGIIRVYCNVHAGMSAFVLVRDNPYFTQPSGDGSFSIPNVPQGNYVLHAWHERSGDHEQEVIVAAGEMSVLTIPLTTDLSGQDTFRSKYTRPYARGGRRY
jgi:plastocyanin